VINKLIFDTLNTIRYELGETGSGNLLQEKILNNFQIHISFYNNNEDELEYFGPAIRLDAETDMLYGEGKEFGGSLIAFGYLL
jgi:hypothetical protein